MFVFEGLVFALTLFCFFLFLPGLLAIASAIVLFFAGLVVLIVVCDIILFLYRCSIRN